MGEHSGATSVAALREARRRKILENSANRLKLIEGINSSMKTQSAEKFLEMTPKLEIKDAGHTLLRSEEKKVVINSKLDGILNENKELQEISDFILRGDSSIDEGEEDDAEVKAFDLSRKKTLSENFLHKKLHYILLAIIINIMLLFNVGYMFYENIFYPFYTVKLVEVLSKRKVEQLQPILLFFISGLPKKLQKFTKLTLFVFFDISDLCLYLFTFVIGNKLATSLK